MPRRTSATATARDGRLSKQGIVAAAVDMADRDGLAALSMRRLAQHLGVDAMSIYYHVRDKETLLGEMADAVVAEIDAGAVPPDGPWPERLRALIMAARAAMVRRPWAAQVLQGRDAPTPATMAHLERMLAIMRGGGCSINLGHHAIHLLGSRMLGFSQDLFDDSPDTRPAPEAAAAQAAAWAETMPHIAELAVAVSHDGPLGGCDDDAEFAFALDVILDGLERRRAAETGR